MNSKASGRSALILAAGVLALLASPVRAATDSEDSATDSKSENPAASPASLHRHFKHAAHHRKHYARHKFYAIAATADADKDADTKTVVVDAATTNSKAVSPGIPPSVANANAQMLLAGVQISAAAAIPAGTGGLAMASDKQAEASADNQVIVAAADQLNDVDRSLHENNTPAAPVASAPTPMVTMTSETSVWNHTSLIGKIFIGFGALLTMASAARMFIA
jgi:Tfp pilus assembly protein PilV